MYAFPNYCPGRLKTSNTICNRASNFSFWFILCKPCSRPSWASLIQVDVCEQGGDCLFPTSTWACLWWREASRGQGGCQQAEKYGYCLTSLKQYMAKVNTNKFYWTTCNLLNRAEGAQERGKNVSVDCRVQLLVLKCVNNKLKKGGWSVSSLWRNFGTSQRKYSPTELMTTLNSY